MENREFISAANLPVAEDEEVSILCVEDGELKQKPAKGLGGSNNLIFKCKYNDYNGSQDTEYIFENPPIGTFDYLKSHLLDGNPVTLLTLADCRWTDGEVEETWIEVGYTQYYYYPATDERPEAIYMESNIVPYVLFSDDTLVLD